MRHYSLRYFNLTSRIFSLEMSRTTTEHPAPHDQLSITMSDEKSRENEPPQSTLLPERRQSQRSDAGESSVPRKSWVSRSRRSDTGESSVPRKSWMRQKRTRGKRSILAMVSFGLVYIFDVIVRQFVTRNVAIVTTPIAGVAVIAAFGLYARFLCLRANRYVLIRLMYEPVFWIPTIVGVSTFALHCVITAQAYKVHDRAENRCWESSPKSGCKGG